MNKLERITPLNGIQTSFTENGNGQKARSGFFKAAQVAALSVLALTGCDNNRVPISGSSQEVQTLRVDDNETMNKIAKDNEALRCAEKVFSTSSSGTKKTREDIQRRTMAVRDKIQKDWLLPHVKMVISGSGGEPHMKTVVTDAESCRTNIRCKILTHKERTQSPTPPLSECKNIIDHRYNQLDNATD